MDEHGKFHVLPPISPLKTKLTNPPPSTGYPGHEFQHREAMLHVLGKEKYEFFFDKFLEYFFTEDDAKFFASLGLNCIRLPFNYRHFEDDMNPRVLKESGFKHLDRVIDLVSSLSLSPFSPAFPMI